MLVGVCDQYFPFSMNGMIYGLMGSEIGGKLPNPANYSPSREVRFTVFTSYWTKNPS